MKGEGDKRSFKKCIDSGLVILTPYYTILRPILIQAMKILYKYRISPT